MNIIIGISFDKIVSRSIFLVIRLKPKIKVIYEVLTNDISRLYKTG